MNNIPWFVMAKHGEHFLGDHMKKIIILLVMLFMSFSVFSECNELNEVRYGKPVKDFETFKELVCQGVFRVDGHNEDGGRGHFGTRYYFEKFKAQLDLENPPWLWQLQQLRYNLELPWMGRFSVRTGKEDYSEGKLEKIQELVSLLEKAINPIRNYSRTGFSFEVEDGTIYMIDLGWPLLANPAFQYNPKTGAGHFYAYDEILFQFAGEEYDQ